jgi:hypothetical protein
METLVILSESCPVSCAMVNLQQRISCGTREILRWIHTENERLWIIPLRMTLFPIMPNLTNQALMIII